MNLDEEQPEIARGGRGRPRKHVSGGRVGRPRTSNRSPYQSRGLRAPKTKVVQPPTQIQTRLRAGAAPKGYKLSLRARGSAHQIDENDDENEEDERCKTKAKAKQLSRRKDEHSNSDEDEDLFGDDSDNQPPRRLPRNRNRSRSSVARHVDNISIGNDDIAMEDDNMDDLEGFGYIPSSDNDGFPPVPETPGRHRREVVAETPPKRSLNDSPDLGAQRSKHQALAAVGPLHLDEIGESSSRGQTRGEPSSQEFRQYSSRTILQTPEEIVEIGKLHIRYFFPSAKRGYLDRETVRGLYWSRDIEDKFNALWQRDEHDSRFIRGPRGDSDELELWKMILIRYRRILPHLFTYGLKLGEDCYEVPQSIMLSSKASYMLQKICAHSIWGESFDMLRLALQMAVKLSVVDHCDPLATPRDSTDVEDYLRDNINEDQREVYPAIIQYRFWRLNRQDDRADIWSLYKKLEKQIKPSPAKSKAEASLFILTMDVMDSVLRVLDEFKPAIYPLRPVESVEAFRGYYGNVLALIEPIDNRQLMDVKWELELQELRDEEIRNAMEIFEGDLYLYDIPHITLQGSRKHIDTVPLYHRDPSLDEDTLPALTGTEKDLKRCTLSRLDRMDDHRAKALGGFRDGLREALSLNIDDALNVDDVAVADDPDMLAALEAEDSVENVGPESSVEFLAAENDNRVQDVLRCSALSQVDDPRQQVGTEPSSILTLDDDRVKGDYI
ncbi:hypothetical protein F4860DRAFT_527740 [Xylaria cubensis]|nr:hypothetical protein F4860DRAFT_527740 [Xylaria cubensis]